MSGAASVMVDSVDVSRSRSPPSFSRFVVVSSTSNILRLRRSPSYGEPARVDLSHPSSSSLSTSPARARVRSSSVPSSSVFSNPLSTHEPVVGSFDDDDDVVSVVRSDADVASDVAEIERVEQHGSLWLQNVIAEASRKRVSVDEYLTTNHVSDDTIASYKSSWRGFIAVLISTCGVMVWTDASIDQMALAAEKFMLALTKGSRSGRPGSVLGTFASAMAFHTVLSKRLDLNPFAHVPVFAGRRSQCSRSLRSLAQRGRTPSK
jgi:hypothetical protein